jgi:GT2 family glycosyltransferase
MKCISSLSRQTTKPAETILALDPLDDLVEFYKTRVPPHVKIVVSDGIGLSYARNAGVKAATGDVVAFIDDDAEADEKWLEKSVENYQDEQVIGVGGFIKAKWTSVRPMWFPEELDWIVGCSYKGMPLRRTTIRNPIGCNMSFRRMVFEKVGYFRTDIGRLGSMLLANEETEFAIRALKQNVGSKIIFEPSALVHHKVSKNRESLKYVWTRSFYEGVSKAIISFESDRSEVLSTEGSFLRFLLSVAIPMRVREIYKPARVSELLTLMLSVFAVFAGFATGRVMKAAR